MTIKVCKGCQESKPTLEFGIHKGKPDGLNDYCKECRKTQSKRRHNKIKNTPKYTNQLKESWQKKKAKYTQDRKEWEEANPESAKQNKSAEERKEYYQQWLARNREKHRANSRRYQERLRSNEGSMTTDEWQTLLDLYGNTCLCCGIQAGDTPLGKLIPDHVVPVSKGGSNSVGNRQPLCFECNKRKKDKIIDYRTPVS